MRAIAVTTSRVLLVLATITAGLTLGGPASSAATVSIDLCALPGTATLTGSVTVPIWGFGIPTTPGDCSTATASLPGPQLGVTLSATETTTVTFNVTNALPAGHSITFEIPGITFDAGPPIQPRRDTQPVVHCADITVGARGGQRGGDLPLRERR